MDQSKVHPLFSKTGAERVRKLREDNAQRQEAERNAMQAVSASLTSYLNSRQGDVVRQFLVQKALERSYDPSVEMSDRAVAYAEGQRFVYLLLLNLGHVAYMKEV